jgi:hypothetical protein
MDLLPNLNIEYQLVDFNEVLGVVTVYFIRSKTVAKVDIPLEEGQYITGTTLDNYIMSWMPAPPANKDYRKVVSNAAYIKSLLTPHNKLPESEVYLRRMIAERREQALRSCDWTQLPDVQEVMPEEEKQRWKKFRQELRDITKQPGYPHKVYWPQRPYMMGVVIYD